MWGVGENLDGADRQALEACSERGEASCGKDLWNDKIVSESKDKEGRKGRRQRGKKEGGKGKKKARKDEPAMLTVAHFIGRKGYLN